jgi:hypothetical protein
MSWGGGSGTFTPRKRDTLELMIRINRVLLVLVAACVTAPTLVSATQTESTGSTKVDVCGIPPGDGAYSYVKVWNMGCAKAKKVASRVAEDFCGPRFERCNPDVGEFVRGHERYRGWKCGLKIGYEFFRVRCERSGKRFVQESAA